MSHAKRVIVGGILMLLWSPTIHAQDVSGTWQFEVELEVGPGSPTFVYSQDGNVLSGTFDGTLGEAYVSGTIQGDQIEFGFEVQRMVPGLGSLSTKVAYTGTVNGDTMTGTCDYGDLLGSGEWHAEKAEAN